MKRATPSEAFCYWLCLLAPLFLLLACCARAHAVVVVPHFHPIITPRPAPYRAPAARPYTPPERHYEVRTVWHPPIFIYLPHGVTVPVPGHEAREVVEVERAPMPLAFRVFLVVLIVVGVLLAAVVVWAVLR